MKNVSEKDTCVEENNGKSSHSNPTKHIKIFFNTGLVSQKEMNVEW